MTAYYNEIDPFAAAWLQNLIDAGHIAPGVVDTRSIEDVSPSDLRGFTQCHFFAGIGGWSLALRLAGWPDDRPAWTGSCPCQPFSAAGKGAGFDDERHLWAAWQHLIAQCQPPVIFGEQVASKGADAWIDLVHADLEGLGYAFGSIPFPAAGVGAPHIRDRNYWMAYADRSAGGQGRAQLRGRPHGGDAITRSGLGGSGVLVGMGDRDDAGLEGYGRRHSATRGQWEGPLRSIASASESGGLAHTNGRHACTEREQRSGQHGQQPQDNGVVCGPVNGGWREADWLFCRDAKWRPVEPGTFPLAHGIPNRVGSLRGYGNAISPYQAEAFIRSAIEVMP